MERSRRLDLYQHIKPEPSIFCASIGTDEAKLNEYHVHGCNADIVYR